MTPRIVRDLLLCSGSAAVIAVAFAWQPPPDSAAAWLLSAALLALLAAMLLHRVRPLLSLCLALPVALWNTASLPAGFDGLPLWNGLLGAAVVVVVYLAGRRADRDVSAVLVLAAATALAAPLMTLATGEASAWTATAVTMLCEAGLPWLLGRYHGQRLAHRDREHRLVVDRERANERARIAQDMHDSVGHELGLIALRAGALELASDLDERHRAAAGELRRAAASAADRLEEVIEALQTDTGPATTPPAQESVTALVENTRCAGVSVELRREGTARTLSPLVDRAVSRVVQEGLTNAVKHAPEAPITVRLAFRTDEVDVSVENGASKAGAAEKGTGGGRGLIGLRERVRLAGGTLSAAPSTEGGFEVAARLPTADENLPAPAREAGTRAGGR